VRAARIAFGGMAATPKRALEVERRLTGAPWTENTLRHAQDGVEIDFTPISDLRGSATYRLNVARNLLRRFYLEQSGDLAKSARLDQGAAP
jgi:xanthine dehydrogenase small subunit